MASEVDRYLSEKLADLPLNHPDRQHLRGLQAVNNAYLHKEPIVIRTDEEDYDTSIGLLFFNILKDLPDDTPIVDIFASRHMSNPNPTQTRWLEVYNNLPSTDRHTITRLTRTIKRSGFISFTLGDLRSIDLQELRILRGIGDKSISIAQVMFQQPEEPTDLSS